MSDIFTRQQIERLEEYGYLEMAAYSDFFDPLYSAIKAAHPKALYVDKVGPNAIGQIVYLPKARRSVLSSLKKQRKEYETAMRCTSAAIATLEKP